MKIITMLGFFGVLSNAHADVELPSTINECLEIPAKPGFDAEKYFKGKWYLTHAQHGATSSICRTVRTILQPNDTLDHTVYGYSQKGNDDIFYNIRCNGNVKKGKVELSCTIVKGGRNNRNFHVEGVVIETDYDHYSIFYRCVTNPIRMGDNILVLNRNKDDTSQDAIIAKKLANTGLDLNEFISRRNFVCKPHPDE